MEGRDTPSEEESDRPSFTRGEVVASENGDYSFRIRSFLDEGRCCLVYSAESIRDGVRVALKVYRKGSNYEGAFQREMSILERISTPSIVQCVGVFFYKGFRIQVLELLESNVRQMIFRNERQGLSPWGTQKFARDVLTALQRLHFNRYAHGDLKPANVMWSAEEGYFKVIDYGLAFHADETELHQIQSSGYRAPECTEWNTYKEILKKRRRRRKVPSPDAEEEEEESSGVFSQTTSNSSLNDVWDERLPSDGDQEWRSVKKLRRRSAGLYGSPPVPPKPEVSSDIWSFGCLLAEVFTGQKLFILNDKMSYYLKPHQMVEMKLGPAEVAYDKSSQSDVFEQVKDLINRCLDSDPKERISSEEALKHAFLRRTDLIPNSRDMVIMPSRVLQCINLLDEDLSPEEIQAIMEEIREEAEKYGEVTGMRSIGRHAYLEFPEEAWIVF
eukprot:TRINITY_DN4561_c0_g1_i1.p1 TRINITY_DN4561_c0_g1~~TRINITY_DN4561_c0_g1_i1.p1  ORF type:complete len:443 (-),score=116.70 TRINITY_DN4561_c0_g1_i1:64-1392(-)